MVVTRLQTTISSLLFLLVRWQASPKVFKLEAVTLESGDSITLSKKLSLAVMTTRKLYPGEHTVEALLNGVLVTLGFFNLVGILNV